MSARPGPRVGLLVLLVLAACGPTDQPLLDSDGDGSPDAADCAPQDPSIYPFAPDPWGDEVDQDCDGADGVDADGDGYPAPGEGTENTEVDCDDARPDVHPHATEIPDNGVDEDCDGADGAGTTPGDFDNDGTPDEEDCDPEDPALNEEDADGDGFTSCGGDCDDTDPDRYPQGGWEDPWDGVDTDCDGVDGTETDSSHAILAGEVANENGGDAVAAWDVDGDGLGDLLIGAPHYTFEGQGSIGRTTYFKGAQLAAGGTLALSEAHATLHCGSDIALLGDLDGDGVGEVAVASATGGPDYQGAVYVFRGAHLETGGVVEREEAMTSLLAEAGVHLSDGKVAHIGDLDGDALSELAISAPGSDLGAPGGGAVWIVAGSLLATGGTIELADVPTVFACAEESALCGYRLVSPGDVDGDGLPDLVVGAPQWGLTSTPTEWGRVFLLSGDRLAAGGALDEADTHSTVRRPGVGGVGWEVAALGDLDGDGTQDLAVVGDTWVSEEADGRPLIVLGSQLAAGGDFHLASAHAVVELADLDGDGDLDDWTPAITGPGDVDGDGVPDLVVSLGTNGVAAAGSPQAWLLPGSLLVPGGVVSLGSATAAFHRDSPEAASNLVTHRAGDIDGDGRPDLLFADPSDGTVEAGAGRAWLLLSP